MTNIGVGKLTIIGSDNGLSPGRRQAIIWTNGGRLLIRTLGTNFSEILSEIYIFLFKKMYLKLSSGNLRPFFLGLKFSPAVSKIPKYVLATPGTWICQCYSIQIKICAEYRDMLPRPRLVCQEPGPRPIGGSPGVPDKSSQSWYSVQILICFIAYIFQFFIPLWVWLGILQNCHHTKCPLPLSIVIRMRLVIKQSKLPACLAEVQLGHVNTLWHLCHRTGEIGLNLFQEPFEWRGSLWNTCE